MALIWAELIQSLRRSRLSTQACPQSVWEKAEAPLNTIGEHGTNEEARELDGLEDIDGGSLNTGDEGTEEGKTDEASGTNGETLANSGSGVTSGIKSISSVSDGSRAFAHLSNTTGIVRDRSVTINGKGNGEST